MPAQNDQWGLPLQVKPTQKSLREKSINETISKMRQFQIQEHDLKDNFYYTDHIDEEIERRLHSSALNEQHSTNIME